MVQDWGIAGQPGSDDVITGRRSGTKANGGNKKFRIMISEKLSKYPSVQDCMKKRCAHCNSQFKSNSLFGMPGTKRCIGICTIVLTHKTMACNEKTNKQIIQNKIN